MPSTVTLAVGRPARSIHLLSGISGWGHPTETDQTVTMIVRLHYENGEQEPHEFLNGVHFAEYTRRFDVPDSEFAFLAGEKQLRYLAIHPEKAEPIARIEFANGPNQAAPLVMAVTLEE